MASFIRNGFGKMNKVFELIPADLLHWSEGDNKYSLLSEDELDKILENCLRAGVDEEDLIYFVRAVEDARLQDILLERFLAGYITIKSDGQGGFLYSAVQNHE